MNALRMILLPLLPMLSVSSLFAQPNVVVEVEELVSTFTPPNNGAGPTWCYGAPLIVRSGEGVYASVMQTGDTVPPLCNTRWQLWHRDKDGWEMIQQAPEFRQREPCPIAAWPGRAIFLSVNPSLTPPGTKYGPCDPRVLRFDHRYPKRMPVELQPVFGKNAQFTDHSYRGFAADTLPRALLLLNIHAGTGEYYVSHYDDEGRWTECDRIQFPIRACYPQVVLRRGAAHVLAIGDIVEPNEEWRAFKFEKTERQGDYVFRRLFYTHSPDVIRKEFTEPLEIENVEATAGYIRNQDLHIDDQGRVFAMYIMQPIQHTFMRDRYFPDQPMESILKVVRIEEGKVAEEMELVRAEHGQSPRIPYYARFHVSGDRKLHVVWAARNMTGNGPAWENGVSLLEEPFIMKPLDMKHPFPLFFTNTTRGGSLPSDIIDLYGTSTTPGELRYARLRITGDDSKPSIFDRESLKTEEEEDAEDTDRNPQN